MPTSSCQSCQVESEFWYCEEKKSKTNKVWLHFFVLLRLPPKTEQIYYYSCIPSEFLGHFKNFDINCDRKTGKFDNWFFLERNKFQKGWMREKSLDPKKEKCLVTYKKILDDQEVVRLGVSIQQGKSKRIRSFTQGIHNQGNVVISDVMNYKQYVSVWCTCASVW